MYKKVNKKENILAIFFALYLKKNYYIILTNSINKINFKLFKIKYILDILFKNAKVIKNNKILIVLDKINLSLYLKIRNNKNIELTTFKNINLKQTLNNKFIIMTNNVFTLINTAYDF